MAHYLDIIENEKGDTWCVLCNKILTDNDYIIETHISDEIHRSLFIKRLMIQNNFKIIQNQTHVLCKELIKDINLLSHLQSTKHTKIVAILKEMIDKDGKFLQLPTTLKDKINSINCLLCNCSIEFNLEAVNDHILSAKHKRARSIIVQPLNGIFSVEGTDDDLWCKICQVYFENYVEIILEHVDEDPEHIKKITKIKRLIEGHNIKIDKYLTDPKEDKSFCRKCNTGVSCNVDNLERHINGKLHKS